MRPLNDRFSVRPYRFEYGFHASPPPPAPTEPSFTAADLARERAAGVAEGRAAALAEAQEASEARLAAALEVMVRETVALFAELDRQRAIALDEAIAVATAIASKLLPALYRREGASEIEAVVAALLPRLFDERSVCVRVHPADEAEVTRCLAPLGERHGFGGRLGVRADAALSPGDCRVEWAAGGAERDRDRLWQDMLAELSAMNPVINGWAEAGRLRLAAQPAVSDDDGNANGGDDGGRR
jgi:flagellar assembly protein FliH